MRLIDADALVRHYSGNTVFVLEQTIDTAPTVDAVEVVRCKDCTWGTLLPVSGTVLCDNFGVRMKERAYCSMGERRDGGEKDE